jgi:hypothetical protein
MMMLNSRLTGRTKLSITALFLAGMFIFFFVMPQAQSWVDSDYSKRMAFNITNRSSLDDEVVPFNITYDSDMQADFDDIRFYAEDDTTQLNYWLEDKVNSDWAYFWVKVNGHQNGYVYYSNSTVSSASDGKATFMLFDDFSGGQNTTLWDESGTVRYYNGFVELDGADDAWLNSDEEFGVGVRTRAKITVANDTGGSGNWGFCDQDDAGSYVRIVTETGDDLKGNAYNDSDENTAGFGVFIGYEYTAEIRWINGTHQLFTMENDTYAKTEKTLAEGPEINMEVGGLNWVEVMLIDWIFVHNDTDAFISVSFGSEENQGVTDNSPATTLATPADASSDIDGTVTFNCSATDDNQIDNITLWHNATGTWHANSTNTSVTGTYDFAEFTVPMGIDDITVLWNCITTDNASQTDWADSNWTVNVADANPTTTLATPADASSDADGAIIFNCSATDDSGISNITLWHNETGTWHENSTNTSVTGTYDFAEFTLDFGSVTNTVLWNCITTDDASQTDWADANWTVNVDSTGDPSVDFVSPTLSNASNTSGADYVEINVSSDEDISECIFEIDYKNYSMTVSGDSRSCYLNFASSGGDNPAGFVVSKIV